jgi:prophage regulatory protein
MSAAEKVADEDLLTLHGVMAKTGASRTRIYGEIKAGRFPAPLRVWGRSLWKRSEVQAWVNATIDAAPRMGAGMGRRGRTNESP